MKIQVKDKSHNGVVFVRRISWQERCEEQLNKIIEQLKVYKYNLETVKKSMEELANEQN